MGEEMFQDIMDMVQVVSSDSSDNTLLPDTQDKLVPLLYVDCTIIQRQVTSHEQDNFITGVYHCLAEEKAAPNIGYSTIKYNRGGQQQLLC